MSAQAMVSADRDIVTRMRSGDREAFAELMRRHNRTLFRTARSILRDDGEAEDALQDAYLQAFTHLAAFRGDAAPLTWLTRIVVNASIARRRKSARMAEVIRVTRGLDADGGFSGLEAPSEEETPEGRAMRGEVRALLEACIDRLPEQFRTVFVLRALEDMPAEQVAQVLGIAEATVRTRFFRARAMLREALAQQIDVAYEEAFNFDGERCDRIVARVLRALDAPSVRFADTFGEDSLP
jgi:RNA polymerase sigma-70 factor (ECF subfamily)